MGTMSFTHWLVVAVVALLFLGGGNKISSLMKDAAHGIKAFRKGMAEDEAEPDARREG